MTTKQVKLDNYTRLYMHINGEKRNLIVSNLTGAVAVIDDNLFNILDNQKKGFNLSDYKDSKYYSDLLRMYEQKILIGEEDDGKEILKRRIQEVKEGKKFELVLAMTMRCNLDCYYCFENHNDSDMSIQTVNRILELVEERINLKKLTDVIVTLYGGEPLMKKQRSIKFLKRMFKITEKNNVKLHIMIITNGTLIDEEFLQQLSLFSKYSIPHLQITLDGPEKIHDKRRYYKNGSGSFKKIINNLFLLNDYNFRVNIRINIDKTNCDCMPELIDELNKNIKDKDKYTFTLDRVVDYCNTKSEFSLKSCFRPDEFYKAIYPLVYKLNKFGFKVKTLEKTNPFRPLYCKAATKCSIVVDPSGNIYSCLSGIGKENFKIGNIHSESIYNDNYLDWMNFSPLNYTKCKNCNIVGFCGGGCIAEAIATHGYEFSKDNFPVCSPQKEFYIGGAILPKKI